MNNIHNIKSNVKYPAIHRYQIDYSSGFEINLIKK